MVFVPDKLIVYEGSEVLQGRDFDIMFQPQEKNKGIIGMRFIFFLSNIWKYVLVGFRNFSLFQIFKIIDRENISIHHKVPCSITWLYRNLNLCVTFFSAKADSAFHPSVISTNDYQGLLGANLLWISVPLRWNQRLSIHVPLGS